METVEELLAKHPEREMRLLGSIAGGLKNQPRAEGAPYKGLAVREENTVGGPIYYLDVFTANGEVWTVHVQKR